MVMILMELLWSIIIYLKRQEFSLNPYIFMGIISSIRGILVVEARLSLSHGPEIKEYLTELGVNSGVILALVGAYYFVNKQKAQKPTRHE